METIRTIIDAERLATVIDLPESMRHQNVEITVRSQTQEKQMEKDDDRSVLKSLKGCLKEYANPDLWKLEEGAWERAAAENYLEQMKNGDFSI